MRELFEDWRERQKEESGTDSEGQAALPPRKPSRMELEIEEFQNMHRERQLARMEALRRDVAM